MTELNAQQLESLKLHLAEKVMGWTLKPDSGWIWKLRLDGEELGRHMPLEHFDPPNNIEQAMGCWKAFKQSHPTVAMALNQNKDTVNTGFFECLLDDAWVEKATAEEAISISIALATGWEE